MELPVDDATVEQPRDDKTVEQPAPSFGDDQTSLTQALSPDDLDGGLHEARTMTEVGTKLDLARAYVDMGDPAGARCNILDPRDLCRDRLCIANSQGRCRSCAILN